MLQLFLLLFIANLSNSQSIIDLTKKKPKPKPTPYQDWDYLVFSQHWPITGCTVWQQKGSQNKCSLPNPDNRWIVHGLWPTKTGTNGPLFCNSSIKFDPTVIAPIEPDLEKYWTNIESNTEKYSLWKHEWKKHGTCAVQIPQLNSVLNYFDQGIAWIKQYNMADILAKMNITPNNTGYQLPTIYNAVKSYLGKVPTVECVGDKQKESLLSEIRICFDKSLNLIDCHGNDGIRDPILTDCSLKKPIIYYGHVPNTTVWFTLQENENVVEYMPIYDDYWIFDVYKLFKFLIWFTL